MASNASRESISRNALIEAKEAAKRWLFVAGSSSSESVALLPSVAAAAGCRPEESLAMQPIASAASAVAALPPATEGSSFTSASKSTSLSESGSSGSGGTVVQVGAGKCGGVLNLSVILETPQSAEGELLSYGSRLHPERCTPCPWQARPRGCLDGRLCPNCHDISHKGLTYARRNLMRKQLQRASLVEQAGTRPRTPSPSAVTAQLPSLSEILGDQTLTSKRTFLELSTVSEASAPLRRTNSEPSLLAL